MIHSNKIYLSLFLTILLLACSKPDMNLPQPQKDDQGMVYFENKQDLINWSNNSEKVCRKKEMGGFGFTLKRLSPDLMALQELQGNVKDEKTFNEVRSHYSELLYFKLNIKNSAYQGELLKYKLENAAEYSRRINYCSFEINKDLFLTNGQDTVPCALHAFERTFDLESGLNFVLAFPVITLNRECTVVYQDRLFKNGMIKFSFDQAEKNLPYFKIK